jgi:hypothetical protein
MEEEAMTRRRLRSVKALLLALTAVAVCVIPTLSLPAFLWLCAVVAGAGFLILVGMLLDLVELYVEFRKFEDRIDEASRRVFGWKR